LEGKNLGTAVQANKQDNFQLSNELKAAIRKNWRAAYSLLFGDEFVDVLAPHHERTIRWHWAARHRICRNERPFRGYYADFPMWSRGHMKSTIARRLAIMDAVIELFYGRSGYCLYFSGTDNKTEKHALSIMQLLQSSALQKHAPTLTMVKRDAQTNSSRGWKATLLYTASGHVFHFGSLQSGLAGGNIDNVRPSIIIPDDIDDRKLSATITEKNFETFTSEILPMGAIGTLTVWAQNLINRHSIMYRIYTNQARVLVNRRPSRPVPAVVGLLTEKRKTTVLGIEIVRDVITAGTATWRYMDITACQDELDRIGLPAFMRECQHEVEGEDERRMLHAYRDDIHCISTSEFASVFGTTAMPKSWRKEWGNDWARTKTRFHANVALWRTVSPRNSPLPGFEFIFNPMSFKANAQFEDVAERVLGCLDEYAVRRIGGSGNKTWSDLRREELLRINSAAHAQSSLERIELEQSALAEIIPQYSEPLLQEHNVIGGVVSHEREDIRRAYATVYGLSCVGVNPGKFGGVEQINRAMAVDTTEDHPFRPGVKGFTRWFVVVPDDTTVKPRLVNGLLVYPPKPYPKNMAAEDLHDDDLFRRQMIEWEMAEPKLLESGEKIDEPVKAMDDFGNELQMMYVNGGLDNEPLSIREEYELLVEQSPVQGVIDATTERTRFTRIQQLEKLEIRDRALRQLRHRHGDDADEDLTRQIHFDDDDPGPANPLDEDVDFDGDSGPWFQPR